MGEFVPKAGKPPLTQLALPTPGPSDYQPKLTISKPAAPQYSIVGKAKKLTGKPYLKSKPPFHDAGMMSPHLAQQLYPNAVS